MAQHTPGPWAYVPSTEHHGPYITSEFGSTIADFYLMSHPGEPSTLNGGKSKPVPFLGEMADANARLAAVAPKLLAALQAMHACHRAFSGSADWTMLDDEARKEAEAVIAEAEGN